MVFICGTAIEAMIFVFLSHKVSFYAMLVMYYFMLEVTAISAILYIFLLHHLF